MPIRAAVGRPLIGRNTTPFEASRALTDGTKRDAQAAVDQADHGLHLRRFLRRPAATDPRAGTPASPSRAGRALSSTRSRSAAPAPASFSVTERCFASGWERGQHGVEARRARSSSNCKRCWHSRSDSAPGPTSRRSASSRRQQFEVGRFPQFELDLRVARTKCGQQAGQQRVGCRTHEADTHAAALALRCTARRHADFLGIGQATPRRTQRLVASRRQAVGAAAPLEQGSRRVLPQACGSRPTAVAAPCAGARRAIRKLSVSATATNCFNWRSSTHTSGVSICVQKYWKD